MEKRTLWQKKVGKELNRLHFTILWYNYTMEYISYADFKYSIFDMVNSVRKATGSTPFTFDTFDKGWQYRTVGHEIYTIAYREMLDLICGCW